MTRLDASTLVHRFGFLTGAALYALLGAARRPGAAPAANRGGAVEAFGAFFAGIGVTPESSPMETLARVDAAERAARWRGYGYLFGYPDAAVDFFVAAGLEGDSTRTLVPRDFRRIETFRKFAEREGAPPTMSSFVYAVPKGAAESPDDRRLRERAAPIYAEYVRRRARWVSGDRNGIVELYREWIGATAR